MPTMLEDDDRLTEHYMSDWLFHNRVDSIVSHVMQIIISNEEFSQMKTFKASDFARSPEKVYDEARLNGAIIQKCSTNGEVKEEFAILPAAKLSELISGSIELSNLVVSLGEKAGAHNAQTSKC